VTFYFAVKDILKYFSETPTRPYLDSSMSLRQEKRLLGLARMKIWELFDRSEKVLS
jgi:hypothetical protein